MASGGDGSEVVGGTSDPASERGLGAGARRRLGTVVERSTRPGPAVALLAGVVLARGAVLAVMGVGFVWDDWIMVAKTDELGFGHTLDRTPNGQSVRARGRCSTWCTARSASTRCSCSRSSPP